MANIIGTKWGSNQLGTAGGTVTWSIAAAGTDISRFGVETQTSVSGESFLDYDFAQVISDAFTEWSKYGDIEFQQVADQGGAAGVGTDADIRIYFGEIPGGTAGYAFYPSSWGSAIAGDILLDTLTIFNTDPVLFFNLVLHEIGHALGLGHVDSNSIMTPSVKKIGLQPDDIAGIQEIYGVQDDVIGEETPPPPPEEETPPPPEEETPPPPEEETPPPPEEETPPPPEEETPPPPEEETPPPPEEETPPPPEDGHDDHDGHNHGEDDEEPAVPIINGDSGDNYITGTRVSEILNGFAGNDTMVGGGGNDTFNGGSGDDRIVARNGNDVLSGQNGNDTLKGNAGADMLFGGSGNDVVKGGRGHDTMNGGTGDDLLVGWWGNDIFEFADGHGHDKIRDFAARNDNEKIDLSGVTGFDSFADVQAAMSKAGKHVEIDTGPGSSILLIRTDISDLDANDFLF